MNFWWVNQNQTFDHEVDGGYMWSPQRNKNGAFNQFYENMRLVEPGDALFSFRDQRIPCLGIVMSNGYESPKPDEFGGAGANWSRIGWRVDVQYTRLSNKIRPKDFISELAPTLPTKYSPLTKEGKGLQSVYLAGVPEPMAAVLLAKIGSQAQAVIAEAAGLASTVDPDRTGDRIQTSILARPDIPETEKEALVKSRRGQGAFRQAVLQIEPTCRVTDVSNPAFLIASHIKPWHKCNTNQERLDANNGLMLTPTVDFLFDRGWISFKDTGELVVSPRMGQDEHTRLNLSQAISPRSFSREQREYLNYHREHVFRS